jgi:chemotaxis family two-component system response regulator Rcp1
MGKIVRSSSNEGTLVLLHIDDSADDRFLVKYVIRETGTAFTLHQVESIAAAVPYFEFHRHDGEPKQFPRPALVLLDYDLGPQTGADFLVWLRNVKKMTSIPVVMLSGSVGEPFVEECYANGANCFLSKPNHLAGMKTLICSLYLSLSVPEGPSEPLHLLPEYQPRAAVRPRA